MVHGWATHVYTVYDNFEHGSNLTIECLQRTFKAIEKKNNGKLPPHLFLQMDNCFRENKNVYVLGYLSWLVERGVFEKVELSFLPVGHTHEDIDQVKTWEGVGNVHHDKRPGKWARFIMA